MAVCSKGCTLKTFCLTVFALIFLGTPAWAGWQKDQVCQGSCGGGCGPCPAAPQPFRPAPQYSPPQPSGPSPAEIAHGHALEANRLGNEAYKKGDWAAAAASYRNALTIEPNNDVFKSNLGHALNMIGKGFTEAGKLNEALEYYRQAVAMTPASNADRAIFVRNLATIQGALDEQRREKREAASVNDALTRMTNALPSEGTAAKGDTATGLQFMPAGNAGASPDGLTFAARDPLAPIKVPVPARSGVTWSKSFPAERAEAATTVLKRDLELLLEGNHKAASWLLDTAKDKGKEKGIEAAIDRLPIKEAYKKEVNWQSGMMQRYKQMYQDMAKDTKNYLLGFSRVSHDAAACLGSAAASACDAEQVETESVGNKYADQHSERWKSWLHDDLADRVTP